MMMKNLGLLNYFLKFSRTLMEFFCAKIEKYSRDLLKRFVMLNYNIIRTLHEHK